LRLVFNFDVRNFFDANNGAAQLILERNAEVIATQQVMQRRTEAGIKKIKIKMLWQIQILN